MADVAVIKVVVVQVVGLVKGAEEGVEPGLVTKTQSSCTIL